ncbi:MAG: AraC family transcriptional regulator, partial [Muribaculaceae bacterium]|nr:AraC family transcriptional regulator [Muribaculaceae bacterium]
QIQHESITSGVDAFMAKPFDVPTLMAKVEQLLSAGDRIARNLRLDRLTEAQPEAMESSADRQLAAVTDVIENNLSNPDLNVDFVCRTLDMQSKALYRLLKKYVGVSPVDYIRQMRLRKAAMLLEQKKFSVSEVMYMVGFSSSSYFAKCFSAMFGCSPGQYPPK